VAKKTKNKSAKVRKVIRKHTQKRVDSAKAAVNRKLPKHPLVRRVVIILLTIVLFWVGSMYGIAQWYIWKHRNEPLTYGVTFIPSYAEYFGLDAKQTMDAIINDLGVRRFRLVSYWEQIEATPGVYDFSGLDWQFEKAAKVNADVSLAIGLRQPRWPECHMPERLKKEPREVWYPQLKAFMTKVIERYKDHSALKSYQLENEFFLSAFGECEDFDRDRLIDEYNLVKQLDPDTKLIISRSNNALGLPVGQPRPDEFAISVYKRVWDKTITKRYFEYPFPAWFYGFLAGAGEIITGKTMIIHELQAESWLPEGMRMPDASIEEQNKSLNAERLHDRFVYGKATGMKQIDLWGVEWWYWRMVHLGDSSLWDIARTEFKNSER
jgi:Beta-galactosidase